MARNKNKKKNRNKVDKKTVERYQKILAHPDVEKIKKTSSGYVIKLREQHWRISTTMHTKLTTELKSTDDVFFGDLKWFYSRFISMSYQAEENSGKKWTQDEDDVLEDMIEDDYCIGDIAAELKRDILAVAIRGAKKVDLDHSSLAMMEREELHSVRFTQF